MGHPLHVSKTCDEVYIWPEDTSEEALEATEDLCMEYEGVLFAPNGEFVSCYSLFYSKDYPNIVACFKARGHTERYDVPALGLVDVDIFTVLEELLKRKEVYPRE